MSRFANLKDQPAAAPAAAPAKTSRVARKAVPVDGDKPSPAKRPPSREGKRAIGGHYSPEMARAINVLAVEEDTSVQALVGEALDLLLRARGRHPFGER